MNEHKHKWTLYRVILDNDDNFILNRRYYCLECRKEGQKIERLNIINNSVLGQKDEINQQVNNDKILNKTIDKTP